MVSRQPCSPFLPKDWIKRGRTKRHPQASKTSPRDKRKRVASCLFLTSRVVRYQLLSGTTYPSQPHRQLPRKHSANFLNSNSLQCSLILTLLSVACLRMQGCRSDRCLPAVCVCLSLPCCCGDQECVEFKDWHLTFVLDSLSGRADPWLKKGKWSQHDLYFFKTVIDF